MILNTVSYILYTWLPKILQRSIFRNNCDDAETRCNQQELLSILKKIILTDLEYALDRKVTILCIKW